jgi:hypothetical protein
MASATFGCGQTGKIARAKFLVMFGWLAGGYLAMGSTCLILQLSYILAVWAIRCFLKSLRTQVRGAWCSTR